MEYLVLAVVWTAWCTVHSVLICLPVTGYLKKKLGSGYRMFRVVYNLIAAGTLIPVLLFSLSLQSEPVFRWQGILRVPQIALISTAFTLFLAGGRHYDTLQFLGIRQIRDRETEPGLTESGGLDTSGVLSIVRHPWYLAGIIIIWARDLDRSSLVVNVVLTLYFVTGAFLEERKLVVEFGETYRRYQENVSMLVPLKWARERLRTLDPRS